MFIDACSLPNGSEVDSDICIIGAGAAGITIARELIGSPAHVCLVESGGLEPDKRTQSLYEGENSALYSTPLDQSRFRYFGGSTNRWAGWCRRLDPIDFEARPWVPSSGWPFGIDELKPWYIRALDICDVGDEVIGAPDGTPTLSLKDDRIQSPQFRLSPPTRFGEKYRDEISRAQNITSLLNANATSLHVDESGARVLSVTLRTLDGRTLIASSRRFVLAAGGIENARLMLVSRNEYGHGIGNGNDLVGRYYMDHAAFFSGVFDASPNSPSLAAYTTRHVSNPAVNGRETSGLALSESVLRREELLNSVARFVPRPAHTMDPAWESAAVASARRIASSAAAGRLPERALSHLASVVRGAGQTATMISRAVSGMIAPKSSLALRSWIESAPKRDNRVTLSSQRNALGEQTAEVRWRVGAAEKRSAIRLHDILDESMRSRGYGSISAVLKTVDDPWPQAEAGASHHIGTTRMHDSPAEGVIDRDCKVHGVENLFIAGSSVFPTCGYANPTLTIIALAVRLAERLKR